MVTEIMNSAHYPFYKILSKQFDNPSHARTRGDQLTFGRTVFGKKTAHSAFLINNHICSNMPDHEHTPLSAYE